MVNIFRQSYEIITTKTCGEMTAKERKMVALATSFVANQLPKVEPGKDNELVNKGLLKLAVMVEEA